MLEEIAKKVLPWLVVVIIAGGFTMYIQVEHLANIAVDYKDRADSTHYGLEESVKYLSDKVIELEIEQKHKLSKEEYYKGIQ